MAPTTIEKPIWNSPVAAAILAAVLSAFATITADRVATAATAGSISARVELLESREHDLETRYPTKDEFAQLEARITDLKTDLREIEQTLRDRNAAR